jgi:replicative DNA helicase
LARQLKERYQDDSGDNKPILVVLDFLQIIGGPEREIRERIGKASYAGRDIAKELNAAVLLLSSTGRQNYDRLNGVCDDKTKPLGAFPPDELVGLAKEAGEIESSADSVMVLGKDPWPKPAPGEQPKPPLGGTRIWLAIAKRRAGATSWVQLRFNGGWFYQAQEAEHEMTEEDEAEMRF